MFDMSGVGFTCFVFLILCAGWSYLRWVLTTAHGMPMLNTVYEDRVIAQVPFFGFMLSYVSQMIFFILDISTFNLMVARAQVILGIMSLGFGVVILIAEWRRSRPRAKVRTVHESRGE